MKRKILAGLLAGTMMLTMMGCGKNSVTETTVSEPDTGASASESVPVETTAERGETSESVSAQDGSTNALAESSQDAGAETPDTNGSAILVAYFSWSGNTEKIANMIAEDTGADLFRIEPVEAYPEDYNAVVDQAKEEQTANARPELLHDVESFQNYDVIFLGYPNWWSDVPMIMNTFMEAHDFSGKTVVPFCTHGGGGFGKSLSSVKAGTTGATVLDGFEVSGSRADGATEDVKNWVDSLNLGN